MKFMLAGIAALGLAGCAELPMVLADVSDRGLDELAERVEDYCENTDPGMRQKVLTEVNRRVDARPDGSRPQLKAADCDGDGQSDF